MPFYEYECDNCKFYTELLQKISDPPLKKCPSCGKSKLRKLVSAPVFRLKGSGWYETDFKSDKENKRNLAIEKETESATSDTKASDSKPSETKADTKPAEPKTESRAVAARRSRPVATAASKARPRPVAKAKPAAKSKSKSAARRKGR
ncbi:MAG TPA: zinc ribbon domain-containing protein [Steroidobacteraceae bacterium]|jgi:putative FmdB family regulatory protein|nr:zinc ribbon domain-containing protein [Steroidobacteraceae bacterium]